MTGLGEDLEFLAFDPPCLGIPSGASVSGRARRPDGRFVEIFLDVRLGRVVQAGFLTDIEFEGMLCGSFWCEAATGADLRAVRALAVEDILARFPENLPRPSLTARACVEAGREAVQAAVRAKPGNPQGAAGTAGGRTIRAR